MTLQEVLTEAHGALGPERRDRSRGRKEFSIDDQNENDVPGSFCNTTAILLAPGSDEFRLALYPVSWDDNIERPNNARLRSNQC